MDEQFVGQQAVGAILHPVHCHERPAAVGGAVEGTVAEQAVEILLRYVVVTGEVFTIPVLEPSVVPASQVHGFRLLCWRFCAARL